MKRVPGRYEGLTARQADLLSYIRAQAARQNTPSFEEMKDALGLSSKSGVYRLLTGLVERGYVARQENRARALWPIDDPTPFRKPAVNAFSIRDVPTSELAEELSRRLRSEGRDQ